MTTTGRGRLFRRAYDDDLDDRDADLSEDEHAWWAAREEVAGVPRGPRHQAVAPEQDAGSPFAYHWPDESSFGPPPPPPPRAGEEQVATDLDVPGGMDLDSAHLVLQVKVGTEWEGITRAHRTLAKQFHPDRLMTYSPEAQELGRTRMAEINAAHSTLRTLHFH